MKIGIFVVFSWIENSSCFTSRKKKKEHIWKLWLFLLGLDMFVLKSLPKKHVIGPCILNFWQKLSPRDDCHWSVICMLSLKLHQLSDVGGFCFKPILEDIFACLTALSSVLFTIFYQPFFRVLKNISFLKPMPCYNTDQWLSTNVNRDNTFTDFRLSFIQFYPTKNSERKNNTKIVKKKKRHSLVEGW